MIGWQWHQLDHMQIICTSLQTDNHASTSTLSFFYRSDTLPAAQPTVSKHWRHCRDMSICYKYMDNIQWHFQVPFKVITFFYAAWWRTCNFDHEHNATQSFRYDFSDLNVQQVSELLSILFSTERGSQKRLIWPHPSCCTRQLMSDN